MARGLLFFCVLLVGAAAAQAAAHAAPSSSLYLELLTWPELRADIAAGKTTILVPIGGTEQNGPQMALGKHNVRVHVLAGKIAEALGNALVAPVIAYVPEGDVDRPSGHLKFPGTITIPVGAFEQTLEYAAKSFKLAGFRNIVFLGDHGGYQRVEQDVAARLNREWAKTPVRAWANAEYYRASEVEFGQLLKSKGYSEAEIGTHAGLLDTSLMMGADPSLVRADLLGETKPGDGVHGNPSRSSAALGQLGVELVVKRTVAAIRDDIARR
ncbi:MAG TPA: creatininase family protein [Stellaceae bacterium]|jgi:creatinine amidohydrolase/Fe(II)-dependent formamide hydrolase-like protein